MEAATHEVLRRRREVLEAHGKANGLDAEDIAAFVRFLHGADDQWIISEMLPKTREILSSELRLKKCPRADVL